MAKKRVPINSKDTDLTPTLDTLFGNEKVESQPDKDKEGSEKETASPNNGKKEHKAYEEERMRTYADVREYYKKYAGGKQYSIYLPVELQKKLKLKAAEEDINLSQLMLRLIVDHGLSDVELKSAYDKAFEKRHPK
ncbi:hypothetical protein GPK34_00815 [Secundilactobacillus kimchicus]|uniref:hypothetical protein n=1 Tax=Secundilactobacillus kimchicus TaxID=528209 RepID=UPI001C035F8D|nr:hypothetical protein [Secundilactobacillus kimchicus]MBT9670580.1 hypothetical protein [Secundilactobacillus kimchicus]